MQMTLRPISFALLALVFAACGNTNTSTTASCDPACGNGEICDDGTCRATGTPDAGPLTCSPACPSYETCSSGVCALSPGRCNTSSDCPAADPICSSNTCTAPVVTQPSTQTYAALIVTNQAYQAQFAQIAQMHTLTGVPTKVATVEEICAAQPGGCVANACHDTAKAIKDYLVVQAAAGVTLVVLGGDNSIVPSRMTHAYYSNPLYPPAFDEDFYSDDYYGDLTNWDTNGDCNYGDDTNDKPAYSPTLGISRISVSSAAELSAYFAKEQAYLNNYDLSRINTALFMSNIATYVTIPVLNTTVPIDSALYFEAPGRSLSFIPRAFDVTKLYSNIGGSWPNSAPLTNSAEMAAFASGFNVVVHSGHGDEVDVTVEQDGSNEFSGDMAYALQNTQFPVMVSCACAAATFADGDACAGQQFITAPTGGGIGYLGNSATGLGLAGGMELLDQFLKYAFTQSNPLIGDVVRAAHANMPTTDGLTVNLPYLGPTLLPVVDITSWRWTQKAATYLGDGLLPIYTDVSTSSAPHISAAKQVLGNYATLTFTPAAGAVGTFAAAINGNIYDLSLDGSGAAVRMTVSGPVTSVTFGFSSATTLSTFQTVPLP
jgi:hypothetical protein